MNYKRHTQTVDFGGNKETIKGYLVRSLEAGQNIFLAKGDSLTSAYPWYSFNEDGSVINDRNSFSRDEALGWAEWTLANR